MNPSLTPRQAALLLDRHEITIRKAVAEGRLPGATNPVRVSPAALTEQWAVQLTNPITGARARADLMALAKATRYPLNIDALLVDCEAYLRGLYPEVDSVEAKVAARQLELVEVGAD
jgi:hypothetical protein